MKNPDFEEPPGATLAEILNRQGALSRQEKLALEHLGHRLVEGEEQLTLNALRHSLVEEEEQRQAFDKIEMEVKARCWHSKEEKINPSPFYSVSEGEVVLRNGSVMFAQDIADELNRLSAQLDRECGCRGDRE